MSDFRRILLIKPSSLGDIVHALPVVSALKQRWPNAHLTWLVKREWADLVERMEGVDRVWPVDGGIGGWIGQVSPLRAERFDLVVDLQGLFRSGAMARLSGGSTRIGFANGREGSPWFYTHRVPVPTADMHAVDRYLLVASALGAAPQGEPQFRFTSSDADIAALRKLFTQKGIALDAPWVAMNVSARWPTKRWPLESFAALADQLAQDGIGPIVVIGGAGERSDVDRIKALTKATLIDMTGETSVGLLPALLAKAAVLVTNDSGPMHVAAAVGTPVVALFGPTSEVRTGPYGARHRVLTGEVSCRPCFSRVCRNDVSLACLQAVQPRQVSDVVRQLLLRRVASR